MQLHIPTLFVAIITACLLQTISISAIIRKEDRDGLRPFIGAMALQALVYALFIFRDAIPDLLSVWGANVAVTVSYSLCVLAVAQFQQRRVPHWQLYAPVILVTLSFAVLAPKLPGRVLIGSAVYLFQASLLLRMLITGIRQTPGCGQYLIIIGNALNIVATVVRVAIFYLAEQDSVTRVADAGLSQSIIYLSVFISLNLVAVGFILMVKERADEKNRLMAITDSLTGCWNRLRVKECMQYEVTRYQRYGVPVSILLIDIDFFKSVNDLHGHVTGDRLLKEFAALVRTLQRDTDLFGRWGGEEFIVVLPSSDAAAAAVMAERIRHETASATFADGLRITISIGLAEYLPGETLEQWIGRADAALYTAKNTGRNRIEPRLGNLLNVSRDWVRLVWKTEYETGHPMIDSQHQTIFEHANRLLDTLFANDSHQIRQESVEQLLAFIEYHFQAEESLLVAHHSSRITAHARGHRHLLERAHAILDNHQNHQISAADFLYFFINELILQHMLVDDRQLSAHLRAEQPA